MEPKDKKFSPCFIPVPKWNPFFLKETDVADDKHMDALFKKLLDQKQKVNIHSFAQSCKTQTKNSTYNRATMKIHAKNLLVKKHLALHPDKTK